MQQTWDSTVIEFNPSIIDESKRIIEGVASAPIFDRQNELVTKSAIERALPEFMVLPILTVQHKEFIAGKVEKAWFDDKDYLHIRAQLKPTREVDGVWDLIKSGQLNSFSISGMRRTSTCNVSGEPCVTTDISLNAITICGSNRVNPEAQFAIAKAIFGDDIIMPETEETPLVKADVPADVSPDMVKAVVEELKSQGLVFKAEDKNEPSDNKSEECEKKEEAEDEVKKAIAEITKSIADISSKYDALSQKMDSVMDQPLQKALGFQVIGNKIVPIDLTDMDLQKAEPVKKSNYLDELVKMRLK